MRKSRDVRHMYPVSLEAGDPLAAVLKHPGTSFTIKIRAPIPECPLCQNGICTQLEDRYCFEDPGCDRLIIHVGPRASA